MQMERGQWISGRVSCVLFDSPLCHLYAPVKKAAVAW